MGISKHYWVHFYTLIYFRVHESLWDGVLSVEYILSREKRDIWGEKKLYDGFSESLNTPIISRITNIQYKDELPERDKMFFLPFDGISRDCYEFREHLLSVHF